MDSNWGHQTQKWNWGNLSLLGGRLKLVATVRAGEMMVSEGRIFPSNLSKTTRETWWGVEEGKETKRQTWGAKYPSFLWFYLEEAELEVCWLWRIVSLVRSLLTARSFGILWYGLWKPGFSGGASGLGTFPERKWKPTPVFLPGKIPWT